MFFNRGRPYNQDEVPGPEAVLRSDDHWSTHGLALNCVALEGSGTCVRDYARGQDHHHVAPEYLQWCPFPDERRPGWGWHSTDTTNHSRHMRYNSPVCNFGDGSAGGTMMCWFRDYFLNMIFWTLHAWYNLNFYRLSGFQFYHSGGERVSMAWDKNIHRVATATWRPCEDGYEIRLYRDGLLATTAMREGCPYNGAPPHSWIGAQNMTVAQWMVYERYLSADEVAELHARPYLPLWRPASVSVWDMGAVVRPRPYAQHRHGPRLVTGGAS